MEEESNENDLSFYCHEGTGLSAQMDTSNVEAQVSYEESVKNKALDVFNEGTVFEYILNCCKERHVCTSDEESHILEVLICSCASMQINNCCGINPNILGGPGVGKSDSAKTVANTYPQGRVIDGYLSKTALQHMTDAELQPMSIILRDDQAMTGDTADLFNASLSKWDEDYILRITNPRSHVVEPFKIPRRCARWTIYAHGTGNDQNHDRQIFLHPDSSQTQRESIHNKMADDVVDPFSTVDNFSVDVSRAIWELFIKDAPYYVQIPFAHEIICDEGEGNRTFKMVLCLTMCFALMAKEKRDMIVSPNGNLTAIVATKDDFRKAAVIMNALIKGKGGSQKHKLTPTGERILNYLMYDKECDDCKSVSFRNVRITLKISSYALTRSIDGLMEIVGIGIDNDGSISTPNAKAFTVDREAFFAWEGSHGLYVLKEDEVKSPGIQEDAPNLQGVAQNCS